jgi:hypothetical protein
VTLRRRELLRRAAALSLLTATGALSACGGEDPPSGSAATSASGEDGKVPTSFQSAGIVLDVSGSSADARHAGDYLATFKQVARDVALNGTGQLYLTFGAGDVFGRERVYRASVAPEHPDNSAKRGPEATEKVNNAVAWVNQVLQQPPEHTAGSALVESISFLCERGSIGPGDVILMLSDCYQFSNTLRFDNDDTFPSGIEAALQKFSDLKMLPNLDGVVLKVPFMMSGSQISCRKVVGRAASTSGRHTPSAPAPPTTTPRPTRAADRVERSNSQRSTRSQSISTSVEWTSMSGSEPNTPTDPERRRPPRPTLGGGAPVGPHPPPSVAPVEPAPPASVGAGRRLAFVGSALVLAVLLVTLGVFLRRGNDPAPARAETPVAAETTTADEPTDLAQTPEVDTTTDDVTTDDAPVEENVETEPTATPVETSAFTLTPPAGWIRDASEVDHDAYVESRWHLTGAPEVYLLIDHTVGFDGTPEDGARSVRKMTSRNDDYAEFAFEPATVAGLSAWRWEFALGDTHKVDWFLTGCGTGYALLGAAPEDRWSEFETVFNDVAESLVLPC